MALDWSAVQLALFDAVKSCLGSGVNVYWASLGAEPMAAKPVALLQVTSQDVAAQYLGGGAFDELRQTDDPDVPAITSFRRHTLSVMVYSNVMVGTGSARALVQTISRGLQTDPIAVPLLKAGVAVVHVEPAQDLTALLDTRGESRAALDLWFVTVDQTADATRYIATADVAVTVEPYGTGD